MKRVIDVRLSPDGINKAIKELESYKRDFKDKCIQFRNAVAQKVMSIAQEEYAEAYYNDIILMKQGGSTTAGSGLMPAPTIPMQIETTDDYTAVVAGGEAIFLEFGTGVFYNGSAGSSPHPMGAQLGFTIGSYPPAPSKGRQKAWGFYEGDTVMVTRGTMAQKVLYRSVRLVQPFIEDIAREVFG